jgi:hypothetical protein
MRRDFDECEADFVRRQPVAPEVTDDVKRGDAGAIAVCDSLAYARQPLVVVCLQFTEPFGKIAVDLAVRR